MFLIVSQGRIDAPLLARSHVRTTVAGRRLLIHIWHSVESMLLATLVLVLDVLSNEELRILSHRRCMLLRLILDRAVAPVGRRLTILLHIR